MVDPAYLARFPGLSQAFRDENANLRPYVADLATTFPLLFYMLATDTGPFARRTETLHLIELGKPLAIVAATYGLPLCLRRIPPEACSEGLNWFAWSGRASIALANSIPDDPAQAATWLSRIIYAGSRCDERFALWVARHCKANPKSPVDRKTLLGLAIFAWFSLRPHEQLAPITTVPWSPQFSFKRATKEAAAWWTRLRILATVGHSSITDSWLRGGVSGGFEFVPIMTLEALQAERAIMLNCVDTYAHRIAADRCRIFAVRQNGKSVATLEIAPTSNGKIVIAQLRGVRNQPVTADVHPAARSWFESQSDLMSKIRIRNNLAQIMERVAELLAPYREAIRGEPLEDHIGAAAVAQMPRLRQPLDRPPRRAVRRPVAQAIELRIPIQSILDVVSRHYRVSASDILAPRRHHSVTLPRQVGMYLSHRLNECPLHQTGNGFGGRDQTTALIAVRKVEDRLRTDPYFRDEIEQLKTQLTRNLKRR